MKRKLLIAAGFIVITAAVFFLGKKPEISPISSASQKEIIPPGIVVTESATAIPPPNEANPAPGDRLLVGYANQNLPPQNDVTLMARAISNFLIIDKQAATRPLSANEEWSAALRGSRSGSEAWFSSNTPAFDSSQRLIDRWGTPLIFHALGSKQWEVRSAGPDRKPWTEDDSIEKFSG